MRWLAAASEARRVGTWRRASKSRDLLLKSRFLRSFLRILSDALRSAPPPAADRSDSALRAFDSKASTFSSAASGAASRACVASLAAASAAASWVRSVFSWASYCVRTLFATTSPLT